MRGWLKRYRFPALAIAFLFPGFLPSLAATGYADPCQADIARLCEGVLPGGGRILQCLMEREREISPACKEHAGAQLRKVKTRAVSWQEACGPDVERLCKGVPPGEGRILACLEEHRDEISPICLERARAEIDKVRSKIQNWQQACGADVQKHCKGVPPGQGRILNCLRQHSGQVSPACRDTLR